MSEIETKKRPQKADPLAKSLARYASQAALVETLSQLPHRRRLMESVNSCHKKFRVAYCETDPSHKWGVPQQSCGCRLCAHEARRRSMRAVHRFGPTIETRKGLRYLVLSMRNQRSLADGMALLFDAWQRLRESKFWKHRVRGAVVALEVTYNEKRGDWHPHLNVLTQGAFLPIKDVRSKRKTSARKRHKAADDRVLFSDWNVYPGLVTLWTRATHGEAGPSGVHIRPADQDTVRELLKYVTKLAARENPHDPPTLVEMPIAVDEFLTATQRRRFVRSYGTFYGVPVDPNTERVCCPDCGGPARIVRGFRGEVSACHCYLDHQGVTRVRITFDVRESVWDEMQVSRGETATMLKAENVSLPP